MKKRIPIGHEDFKRIIEDNLYYVDKSLMIRDLADSGAKVNLFTRPRRFGKTLNLSMIRRFFEDERDDRGEKIHNGSLFDGLGIMNAGEKYTAMQQQYPVINLSLKSAKQGSFSMAYAMLKKEIALEFDRHRYILEGDVLSDGQKQTYTDIINLKDDDTLYYDALRQLSVYLEKFHRKKVIVLIDEYDVPLENAYFQGFYDEMVSFIRSLFESVLKTNDCLQLGVVTGCLRISRESIFTGLNNLNMESLVETGYPNVFGFTQKEIDELLSYYGLENKREELKKWYDGYRIGGVEIYNPWSVLNYMDKAMTNVNHFSRAYWANTSSNSIIAQLIENADAETKAEMELLMNGETIEKPVHEEITYEDIHKSMDNLWNFLFFTGYLKNCGERFENNKIYMKMAIPNLEISAIYESVIMEWFEEKVKENGLDELYAAAEKGDAAGFGEEVTKQLQQSISFYDYAENYYHGFLTGLLKGMPGYIVVSNRESGLGRADLLLKENKFMGRGIIIELKVADKFQEMEKKCEEALAQIEEKNYMQFLTDEGCQEIIKYGISFFKKGCIVKRG